MSSNISRRDFLKVAGLLPVGLALPRFLKSAAQSPQAGDRQNVLIIVFDAFASYNMSLYGYPRETTPNISRLSKRAVVYHNHDATGDYTTAGTASLLTGTYPWTHRALQHNSTVADIYGKRTIFDAFPDYFRMAYTHNLWAQTLLRQFRHSIDQFVRRRELLIP